MKKYDLIVESPEHYFYENVDGNEIELDYVNLLAYLLETGYNDYKEMEYEVTDITWQKSEYTKEENELIQRWLNDPEKRKKIDKKIIEDMFPTYDF